MHKYSCFIQNLPFFKKGNYAKPIRLPVLTFKYNVHTRNLQVNLLRMYNFKLQELCFLYIFVLYIIQKTTSL